MLAEQNQVSRIKTQDKKTDACGLMLDACSLLN